MEQVCPLLWFEFLLNLGNDHVAVRDSGGAAHRPAPPPPARPGLTCLVGVEWTLAPRQGLLEGVEEVPHDPGDDGVVVEAHHEGHEHGRDAWGDGTSVLGRGSLLKWGSLLGLGVPSGVEAVLGWEVTTRVGAMLEWRVTAGVGVHF